MKQQQRTAAWLGVGLLTSAMLMLWQQRHASAGAGGPRPTEAARWDARLEAARRIDINAAGVAELERLPGIGPRLARRIAQERDARGPFRRPADLVRVPGIGEKTLERLQDYVAVK